jgi:hypothetical protein
MGKVMPDVDHVGTGVDRADETFGEVGLVPPDVVGAGRWSGD